MISKKTLILGLGNDILSDDRIGPQLVRDLAPLVQDKNIHFEIAASGGFEIVEYIRQFERVIIIDSIKTKTGKPGDVSHYESSQLTARSALPHFHDIDIITALELGKNLFPDLTGDLHVVAVEIVEDTEFSEELTPPLKKTYAAILKKVTALINEIVNN